MDNDSHDIEWLSASATGDLPGSKESQTILRPLLRSGLDIYVENAHAEFRLLRLKDMAVPVTINNPALENSYITSPWNHYVTHAREQLKALGSGPLLPVMDTLLSNFGAWLREGDLDQVVTPVNWLLPANPYYGWTGRGLNDLTTLLNREYPDRAIVFRSLNEELNARLMVALRNAGYQMLPARPVHVIRVHEDELDESNVPTAGEAIKHYQIRAEDYARIAELQHEHDMRLPSSCHPKFTEEWVRKCHRSKFLKLIGIRGDDGQLMAVAGFQTNGSALALPVLAATNPGARAQLASMVREAAARKGLVIYVGPGPTELWEGQPNVHTTIEYHAVKHDHLGDRQKSRWDALELLLTRLGMPLARKMRQKVTEAIRS